MRGQPWTTTGRPLLVDQAETSAITHELFGGLQVPRTPPEAWVQRVARALATALTADPTWPKVLVEPSLPIGAHVLTPLLAVWPRDAGDGAAPAACVELIEGTRTPRWLQHRTRLLLAGGVEEVWWVFRQGTRIEVHRADGITTLTEDGVRPMPGVGRPVQLEACMDEDAAHAMGLANRMARYAGGQDGPLAARIVTLRVRRLHLLRVQIADALGLDWNELDPEDQHRLDACDDAFRLMAMLDRAPWVASPGDLWR